MAKVTGSGVGVGLVGKNATEFQGEKELVSGDTEGEGEGTAVGLGGGKTKRGGGGLVAKEIVAIGVGAFVDLTEVD